MARVTREERKKRRISALSRLQDGWGTGETIQYLMRDYGLTRRSANLDVVWANKELSKGFNNHDNKEMVAWLLTQYQRLAVKSESDKQYGVSLGCYKEIANLVIKPNQVSKKRKTFEYQFFFSLIDSFFITSPLKAFARLVAAFKFSCLGGEYLSFIL